MTFQFASLQEFMFMAGHGGFVWACYGVTLLGLAGLIVQVRLARQRFIREQLNLARRQQARAEGGHTS